MVADVFSKSVHHIDQGLSRLAGLNGQGGISWRKLPRHLAASVAAGYVLLHQLCLTGTVFLLQPRLYLCMCVWTCTRVYWFCRQRVHVQLFSHMHVAIWVCIIGLSAQDV